MKKVLILIWLIIMHTISVGQVTVNGKVLSKDQHKPIENATIIIPKSGQRARSDKNGNFQIKIKNEDSITITHISYKIQSLKFNNSNDSIIKIYLTPLEDALETITVNTGYQRIPKTRSTGSFETISEEKYNEQIHINVLDGIQYITNGLTEMPTSIGSSNSIIIRGINSFNSTQTKPLIILDNFPYEGDINNINPNDVESITVLKDAAAASIWGAKAGNGVIAITTKKGKYNSELSIEANASISVIDEPNLYYLRNLSTSEYIDIEILLFEEGFYDNKLNFPNRYASTPVANILQEEKIGKLSHENAVDLITDLREIDTRQQWLDNFYNKGINQQYGATIKGGSNSLKWMLSTSYNKNVDNLSKMSDRINLHWNNTYKILKNLSISTNIFYSQVKNKSGKPGYGTITTNNGNLPPYTQLISETGDPLPIYTKYRQVYIDSAGGGRLLDWNYYPINDYQYDNNTSKSQDLNAEIAIKYKIKEWLDLSLKYRYEKQNKNQDKFHGIGSFYTRDLINNYTQIDQATETTTYNIPNGNILDQAYLNLEAQDFRGQIDIKKDWAKHSISSIIGIDISESKNETNTYRTYDYNPNILTYTNVDFANTYPIYSSGGNNFIPNPKNFSKYNNRFVSYFGNIAYTYQDKYTITASSRRDASNLFGVTINNKWKPLWSIGTSWNISDEPFYNLSWLSQLKLRTTFGHQGNIDPTQAAITTIIYSSNSPFTHTPMAQINNYPNPDLKWEQVSMLNIGLDFKTKKGTITGSLEYYNKHMTDLFGEFPIETTTGLGRRSIIRNVGAMKGHGIDVELNSINLNGRFRWTSNLIFNTYKDKVTKSSRTSTNLLIDDVVGGGKLLMEGYPLYGLFAYRWAGLNPVTGDPQGYIAGKVSQDYDAITGPEASVSDLIYKGNVLPTTFGSLGNTFTWKGLSLSIRMTYKLGYSFLRKSINYNSLFSTGVSSGSADYSKRWQKPGDEKRTNVPSLVYPVTNRRYLFYSESEALVTKGDHVRLQYAKISYNIKQNYNSPFKNLNVFFAVNNIGIIWRSNKYGIDPDYGDKSVPNPISVNCGINIYFK